MHMCKFCNHPLERFKDESLYDKYPMHDPEGFRGNYECTWCHSIFGMTKSSLVVLEQSIYINYLFGDFTLREMHHMMNKHDIRSFDDFKEALVNSDDALLRAIACKILGKFADDLKPIKHQMSRIAYFQEIAQNTRDAGVMHFTYAGEKIDAQEALKVLKSLGLKS